MIYKLEDYKEILERKEIKDLIKMNLFNKEEGRIKSLAEGVYSKEQGRLYLYQKEDKIIALCGVRRVDNTFVEIINLAVDEEFRKKGISRELLNYLKDAERVDYIKAVRDKESSYFKHMGFKEIVKEDHYTSLLTFEYLLEV